MSSENISAASPSPALDAVSPSQGSLQWLREAKLGESKVERREEERAATQERVITLCQ
jgi:hypothetical protein